jgi:hypothetical protein
MVRAKLKREKGKMDMLDKIMAYENGEMEEEETINFFQQLINTGMAWTLQGHYGRMATALINDGRCTKANDG